MFSLQVRQTRVAALLGVFGGSAMLWVFWTSGCYAFVFQQPIGIGPEIQLARGTPRSNARACAMHSYPVAGRENFPRENLIETIAETGVTRKKVERQ